MGSLTRLGEDPARPVAPGADQPARTPAGTEHSLDDLHDDGDIRMWCEDFRQGTSEIDLCGKCGTPTGVFVSLGEWVDHPVICGHCLRHL